MIISYPIKVLPYSDLEFYCERISNFSKNNSSVNGLFLIGSFAQGTQDKYSDIDFVVISNDEKIEEVFSSLFSALSLDSSIILVHDMNYKKWIASLENTSVGTIKIDYDIYGLSTFKQKIIESYNYRTTFYNHRLLYDRNGLISHFVENQNMYYKIIYPEIDIKKFILGAWTGIRMCLRGELWEARDILNNLIDPFILCLLCNKFNYPFENYRRIEYKIPYEYRERLFRILAKPTYDELTLAYAEIIRLFKELIGINDELLLDNYNIMLDYMEEIVGIKNKRSRK